MLLYYFLFLIGRSLLICDFFYFVLKLGFIPSRVQGENQTCFDDLNELYGTVVELYIAMWDVGPSGGGVLDINNTYGWIDEWCFGPEITSFAGLFTPDRHPALQRVGWYGEDLSGWQTENIVRMDSLFLKTSFPSIGVAAWDTRNVQTFSSAFDGNGFFNEDIGGWDVSSALIMFRMFTRCARFNQDLDRWKTDSLVNVDFMFAGATNFNGKVNGWNTEKLTSLQFM